MSDVLCQGFHSARDAGLLQDDAAILIAVVLPGFAVTEDAVNVSDSNISLYEHDGLGYSRHAAANVTWQWDTTNNRMLLDFDDDTEAFGDEVLAASDPPLGIVAILQAGGSPDDDADYILGLNDEGAYGNSSGLAYGIQLPPGGLMFSRQAA
jgi:hypothetical protein